MYGWRLEYREIGGLIRWKCKCRDEGRCDGEERKMVRIYLWEEEGKGPEREGETVEQVVSESGPSQTRTAV